LLGYENISDDDSTIQQVDQPYMERHGIRTEKCRWIVLEDVTASGPTLPGKTWDKNGECRWIVLEFRRHNCRWNSLICTLRET